MNANWIWSALMVIAAAVLIYFVVKGVLFVGWAVGGVVGVILAIMLVFGVLNMGWFVGLILLIIVLNLIFGIF
jgi:hypothetical protein